MRRFRLLKHKLKLKQNYGLRKVRLRSHQNVQKGEEIVKKIQLHSSIRSMGSLAFRINSASISMEGLPSFRHSNSLGMVFIFMKRQSLQAQFPVRPSIKVLSGNSCVSRCIMPLSVKIMKVSEEWSLQNFTIFSELQTSSCKSRTVCTHSGCYVPWQRSTDGRQP